MVGGERRGWLRAREAGARFGGKVGTTIGSRRCSSANGQLADAAKPEFPSPSRLLRYHSEGDDGSGSDPRIPRRSEYHWHCASRPSNAVKTTLCALWLSTGSSSGSLLLVRSSRQQSATQVGQS